MAATTVQVQMQQRRDTASGWTSANPTLLSGEFGVETDTNKVKIGDGSTTWNALTYIPGFSVSAYPLAGSDIATDADLTINAFGASFVSTPKTLAQDATIPSSRNAVIFGPSYTIGTGVTLTVSTGSFLRIL